MNPSIEQAIRFLEEEGKAFWAFALKQMAEEHKNYENAIWSIFRTSRHLIQPNDND